MYKQCITIGKNNERIILKCQRISGIFVFMRGLVHNVKTISGSFHMEINIYVAHGSRGG